MPCRADSDHVNGGYCNVVPRLRQLPESGWLDGMGDFVSAGLRRFGLCACLFFLSITLIAGCRKESGSEEGAPARRVVVYTSVDEVFARQVLAEFERRHNVAVAPVFDSEAGKTTGLVNRIMAEAAAGRPRGDVFWSGELFHTILLARRGHLEPYDSPVAADLPAAYRDAEHRWTATAVRARVLTFDPQRLGDLAVPTRWAQLAEPAYAARTTVANPLFGTTYGHLAAMFALWGPERSRAFLQGLKDNGALISDGNSSAVRAVMDGRVIFAATDTDDVWVAKRTGANLELRYLDMGDGGTLLIPASVGLIKGGPNTAQARAVVDYLVSAEVERQLAEFDWRSIPVRESLRESMGLNMPPGTSLPFDKIADHMDEAAQAAREILLK